MLRVIGVFLFLMFVGPLAGSSVILAVIAALRSAFS